MAFVTKFTTTKYGLDKLISSTHSIIGLGIFAVIGLSFFVMKIKKLEPIRTKTKLPKQIFSLITSILILIVLVLILFGPSLITKQVSFVKNSLITPISSRFGLTVAENKQPFFINDWKGSFGPTISNIPIYFWLFFVGSVAMFRNMVGGLTKRERIILTFSYFVFLFSLIFSRYSPSSVLNGTNSLSLWVYFGGWIFFLGTFGYFYYRRHKEGGFSVFREFNFAYILYFIILTLGIIGARGGIRLIMVLGAVSPVAVAFLNVKIAQRALREKSDTTKIFVIILAIIVLLASFVTIVDYYNTNKAVAAGFAPGHYQSQWQQAMAWVRENTQQDAVFGHWWDYGYWIQSIGERATILDGSNSIIYWNHLLGRHVLTGTSERDALEFLYAHNGTHFLIDSTDIGKYTAYASIGADENYDRFSWIPTFTLDESQTQETQDKTTYLYAGGTATDADIIFNLNGTEIFLPARAAVVGGFFVSIDNSDNVLQPEAVYIYNNQQFRIPLRYTYYQNELHDYGSGFEAGLFIYPSAANRGDQLAFNPLGTALYLSERTINSNLAQLYLFDRKSDNFKLVHTQTNLVVENLRQQGIQTGEFLQYQGFQGPIKIWEIDYPIDIKFKPEYLETKYPNEDLRIAKPGQY